MSKRTWIGSCSVLACFGSFSGRECCVRVILTIMVLALAGASQPAAAECAIYQAYIHNEDRVACEATDVALAGSIACTIGLRDFHVIDISDPADLQELAHLDITPGARAMAVAGDYAYVAINNIGVMVIDVSDAENPLIVQTLDTPGNSQDCFIFGSYLFVADGSPGLQVIDISVPAAPVIVGTYNPPFDCYLVAAWGDFAYVYGSGSVLGVVDVSDPSNPYPRGFTYVSAIDLDATGGIVFVAESAGNIRAVDASIPESPTIVGTLAAGGMLSAISIDGETAYVTGPHEGVFLVDVSDPADMDVVASAGTFSHASGVAVAGGYAFVADTDGLASINIYNPYHADPIGGLELPSGTESIEVSGTTAYLTDGAALHIVDISDAAFPSLLGSVGGMTWAGRLDLEGDFAYIAEFQNGVAVVDISVPESPQTIGHAPAYQAQDVVVDGAYAYVADGDAGFKVFDVTEAASPTLAAADPSFDAFCVDFQYPYVYVAGGYSGFLVVDATDPHAPFVAASLAEPTEYVSILSVIGNTAYVALGDGIFRVVDISDPLEPAVLGQVTAPPAPEQIAVIGDYAYMAGGRRTYVLDLSVPTDPRLIGTIWTGEYHRGAAGAGSFLCLAGDGSYLGGGGSGGSIRTMPVQCPAAGAPVVDPRVELPAIRVYPNPSSGEVTVECVSPVHGDMQLAVYDVSGRLIRQLVAGSVSWVGDPVVWDGRDGGGRLVSGGIYYLRANGPEGDSTRRVGIIR